MKLRSFNIKTIIKKHNAFILALIFLSSVFNYTYAGIERVSNRIVGNQIFVGQSFAVIDNKYPNVNLSGGATVNYSIGKITLGVDYTQQNTSYNLNSFNFNYNVVLKVTYALANGSALTKYEKLQLNYSNLNSGTIDKSFAIIKDAHLMSIIIDHFENSSGTIISSPLVPSNLYLEAEIETERFYQLSGIVPILNHNYISTSNELEIYWNSIPGAEEYELEWTYVNSYNSNSHGYDYANGYVSYIQLNNVTGINFTFNNNATKIRTTKNSFKIGLNYSNGLLVYRLRPIGKDISNTEFESIGNWTLNQPSNVPSLQINSLGSGFDDYYEILTSHEENKNWQYTSTYAEDGKKKEVISYFDGSFRNRQTVTKTNTEDISIIAETVYDKQGRGAVQILPTPSSNYVNDLKYHENFNQSETFSSPTLNVPFSKADIEITSSASCPYSPGPLLTRTGAEGASIYYSEFNSKKNENQNAFIPDAEKFPFTTTIFTPDNTGRVKRQSGVGPTNKIGSNHETIYLYGDPDQEDLDRLFGSEAGYAERYKKNLVIDPNGQISVSYLNTENKVVATALAGNTPGNVNGINATALTTTTVSYFDYNDSNYDQINKAGANAITFGRKITPTVSGIYTFSYNLTVPSYTDECIPDFCYDCVYDLDIKITDECGSLKYSNTEKVGLNGNAVDYTCNAPIVYTTNGITPTFEAYLNSGKEYFLSKTLSINNDALLDYLAHYMDTVAKNNTCLKTVKDFTTSPTATVSTLGCDMTCEQCAAQVEAYFNSHQLTSNPPVSADEVMTLGEKEAAIKECMRPCTNVSLCEVQFENLLQDVRPNGQYANYNLVAGLADATSYELSIFNDNNKLPLTNQECDPATSQYSLFGVTYDIKNNTWRSPEFYNQNTFNFSSPNSSYSKDHYFNADGSIGKVRIIQDNAGTNYLPAVINTGASYIFTDAIGQWTYPENLVEKTDFINAYISNPGWALSLVKYHPEFNYYIDCSRQTNPIFYSGLNNKEFDDLLMSLDTYAAASSNTLPFILTADNIATDLVNADPYFNGAGPGASSAVGSTSTLKTIFQSRLSNYIALTGGGYMSIKEAAATIHSTGNMYYTGCTGVFGATTLPCSSGPITISTTALDNMWKAYRSMYLAEKNKLIIEQSHLKSVYNGANSNYYNGAIGDPNFNEWVSYQNYGYFPFFPYGIGGPWNFPFMLNIKYNTSAYPNCTGGGASSPAYYYPSGFVKGYYDFGSPSSFYHKDKYANKSRRFIDQQTLNNSVAGGASDPQSIADNLINSANNQIQLNTGECPIYKRLELFLTTTFNNGTLLDQTMTHPLVNENSFTRDLYDKLISCIPLSAATWHPYLGFKTTIDASNNLRLKFYKDINLPTPNYIVNADITLSPPSSITGFNWANVKMLSSIHFAGNNGTSDYFTLMGAYDDPSPVISPVTISLNGTTDCIQSNCSPAPPVLCQPTQQAIELQSFLNSVAADYTRVPAASFPLDLYDVNNYSAQNFTGLVRYPFGNTVVGSNTHQVQFLPLSNSIIISGLNSFLSTPGNVDVTFNFSPVNSGDNLNNIIGFTGLVPKQNPSASYDFRIKAIYGTPGNLVYKTFNVTISYAGAVCGNTPASPCLKYVIANCDENVSSVCANDDGYKTSVDFSNFIEEALLFANNTPKLLSTYANYTSLLKNQVGSSANQLYVSNLGTASTWTYDAANNLSSVSVDFNFVNVTSSSQTTVCAITTTLSIKGDQTLSPVNGNTDFSVVDFKVIDEASGEFQFIIPSGNGNDFIVHGFAPCLNMANCEPCPMSNPIFIEDFDSYSTSTTSGQLNFTNSITNSSNVTNPLSFAGMGVCSPLNQFSIINHVDALSCYAPRSAYDHTKYNTVRNFMEVKLTAAFTTTIVPYEKTVTNLVAGKQYEISAYVRSPFENSNNKVVKLKINNNNGTQDILLGSVTNLFTLNNANARGFWKKLSGFFTATSTSVNLKLEIENNSDFFQLFIDDISIREKQCENPPLFVPPTSDPPENDCYNQMVNIQTANAQQEMTYFLNNMKQDFVKRYTEKCLQTIESMQAKFDNSEGHYTLYYYDQAGNLIKTVPPEGVELLNLSQIDPVSGSITIGQKIKNDRTNHTKTVFTNHRLATRYEYNSLNQLVRQYLPDHSATEQWNVPVNNSLPSNLQTSNMDFTDALNGFMTANDGSVGYIYSTQDGGQTWSPVSALGLADMIDFEVNSSSSTAYVITSDGNLLTSSNYSSTNPVWTIVSIPSSLEHLNDIEFVDANNGYIVGDNGLVLETSTGGASWNVVTLPTTNKLTKVAHKDNGFGNYVVISGENGELYYKEPSSSSFVKYYGISTLIDINDFSIVQTGNATSSFLSVLICGKDKSGTVHKANSLYIVNVNTNNTASFPSVLIPITLSSSGISTVNHSKFNSIAFNQYVVGTVTHTELYLGGVTESVPPKPLLVKFSSAPGSPTTDANIFATTTVNGEIRRIALKNPNAGASSDIYGTLENGQLLKHVAATNITSTQNLTTTSSINNTTALNGIYLNPSNTNLGYLVGDNGTIIAFDETSTLTSHAINSITNAKLNSVTAAKDGSGNVYVVGDNGNIMHSSNNGSSWQFITAALPSGVNLHSALYVSGITPKVVLAGDQSFVGEMTVDNNTTNSPVVVSSGGTSVYKTIKKANNGSIFVIGQNSGSIVSKFNLGSTSLSSNLFPGLQINDMDFMSPNIVYAVGNSGNIYKSTDDGLSFTSTSTSGTTQNLNRVVVADNLTAYALGDNSTILKTTDGGLNWISKATPSGAGTSINSVYNLGNHNIIVAGIGTPGLFNINDRGDDYSSRFYYDALGRLIISQNSKQYNKPNRSYSYTIYDAIGRISQVGEISGSSLLDPDYLTTSAGIININSYNSWLTTGTKTEVTTTLYDAPVLATCGFVQDNLRKRVSATYLDNDDNLTNGYLHATLYSYDIHGNVKSLLNENPNLPIGHTCKKIDYSYDLISGKVNMVSYQKGQPDAFYHKYDYDADNRITNAWTSKEGYVWEQDAKYFYYLHGPLARTEIGHEKVQGIDYAYTIQGWIKGINSGNLTQANDIGKDGDATNAYNATLAGLNQFISNDAASYSLNYFGNDYKAINTNANAISNRFYADASGVSDVTNINNWLYNGNITSMATTIQNPSTNAVLPQLMTYKYDQLNRINTAQAYAGITANAWNGTSTSNYKNEFTYDANGNIETQKRHNETGALIEDLTYKYHTDGLGKKRSNRLYHVNDAVTTASINDDIEDQGVFTPAPPTGNVLGQINSTNNYAYDEIGNLVKDVSEGIQNIEWTVYGKISKVTRVNGFVKPGATTPPSDLEFLYDASGNRVVKIVKPRDLSGQKPSSFWKYTYYERDAQGNVMAIYEKDQAAFSLIEHHLYGSSRLGIQTYVEPNNVDMTSRYSTNGTDYVQWRDAGNKNYELSNHLGNVLSIVTDLKIPVATSGNPNQIDHYVANIISSTDYYPFGSPMSNRSFNANSSRYGMNGKEKDDEIVGSGNSYDFGERIYSPRIGRWLSPDPQNQFILSPYLSFANNPILFTDPDGGWIPGVDDNGKIYVVAEKGDNLQSLYKFFGGKENAAKYLPTYMVDKRATHFKIEPGGKVAFNSTNVYSKAMKDGAAPENKSKYSTPKSGENRDKNYNCHTAALSGTKGQEFHNKGNTNDAQRDADLKENYENVQPNEAVFGETVVTFGDEHSAAFFGRSSDGTTYVFSKNGTANAPTINTVYENTGGVDKKNPDIPAYGSVGNTSKTGGNAANSGATNMKTDKSGRQVGSNGQPKSGLGTGYYNKKD